MIIFIAKSSALLFLSQNLMRFFKCIGFHDKIEKRIIFSGWGGEVRGGGVVTN